MMKINPIMWLPRSEFKKNIRAAKFKEWPTDALTGDPIGGKELEKAERKRISTSKALIGDAALDAVFDSWAWVSVALVSIICLYHHYAHKIP